MGGGVGVHPDDKRILFCDVVGGVSPEEALRGRPVTGPDSRQRVGQASNQATEARPGRRRRPCQVDRSREEHPSRGPGDSMLRTDPIVGRRTIRLSARVSPLFFQRLARFLRHGLAWILVGHFGPLLAGLRNPDLTTLRSIDATRLSRFEPHCHSGSRQGHKPRRLDSTPTHRNARMTSIHRPARMSACPHPRIWDCRVTADAISGGQKPRTP